MSGIYCRGAVGGVRCGSRRPTPHASASASASAASSAARRCDFPRTAADLRGGGRVRMASATPIGTAQRRSPPLRSHCQWLGDQWSGWVISGVVG